MTFMVTNTARITLGYTATAVHPIPVADDAAVPYYTQDSTPHAANFRVKPVQYKGIIRLTMMVAFEIST